MIKPCHGTLARELALVVLLVCATTAPSVTRAASSADADTETAGEIVVTGARYAAPTVTGCTKTDTPLIEIPQSISVITRDQMDDRGVNNLTDALHYAAGVRTDEASGAGITQDNFYIRGFSESGIGSYLDGLRQSYEPVDGAANTFALERVEVVWGPSSVLYGQNDPGGLVNLVSKRPTATPTDEVDLSYGRYNRRQLAIDYGGSIDAQGQWLYRGVALFRRSDTETNFFPDDTIYVAPSLTWAPSDHTHATLLTGFEKDKSAFSYGLPPWGSVLANPNGKLPWDFFSGDPSYTHKDVRRFWAGYEFVQRLSETWTFTQNARYTGIQNDDYRLGPQGNYGVPFDSPFFGLAIEPDNRTFDRSAQAYFWQIHMTQIDSHATAHVAVAGMQHTLLLGVNYGSIIDNNKLGSGAAPSLDLFAPLYHQTIDAPPVDTLIDQRLTQVGVYAQDQIRWGPHWVAVVGLRHDHADLRQETTALYLDPPETFTNTDRDNKLTYRAGLSISQPMAWHRMSATQLRSSPTPAPTLRETPFHRPAASRSKWG